MTIGSVFELIKTKQVRFSLHLLLIIASSASLVFLPQEGQFLSVIILLLLNLTPLILRKPEWIILGLIIFIPLEEFIEKWLPRGLIYEGVRFGSEAILILLLIFVLLNKFNQKLCWQRTPIEIPLILFILVTVFSSWINSSSVYIWILGIRPLVRYITIYYILTQLRVTSSFLRKCFKLSLIVATLVALVGLMQTVVGYPLTNLLLPGDVIVGETLARAGQRHVAPPRTYIFSTMGRYDTLGVYLMFFLLLSTVAHMFTKERKLRPLIVTFLFVGFVALSLTFSRQSWLGFGWGLAGILLFSGKKKLQRTKLVYFIIVVLFSSVVMLLIPYAQYFSAANIGEASILDRVLEPFSSRYLDVSRNYYGRLYVIFEVGPRLLRISPLFGLGPGQFGSLTTRFLNIQFTDLVGIPESAAIYVNDVNWIVLLGQTGLLGIFTYLGIYLSLFWGALKRYKRWSVSLEKGLALGYMGSILALILLGFFGPNLEVRQLSFFVWLWGGLIMGLNKSSAVHL